MTEKELKKYTVDFMNNETGSNRSNLNSIMGKMLIRYSEIFQKRIAELEKENVELKNRNQELLESCEGSTMMYKDLQKAKEIIKTFLGFAEAFGYSPSMDKFITEAEQFINENSTYERIQKAKYNYVD